MKEDTRLVEQDVLNEEEESFETSIRPHSLDEYIGQKKVTRNLRIFIEAAKKREEVVDHILFYGPPRLR